MKQVILLVALFSVAFAAFSENEYQTEFANWMHTHQKSYSASEFHGRYNVFKGNMDYVHQWNAAGSDTVLGLTHLADITNAEYRQIYLGTHIDGTARLQNAQPFTATVSAPASVNWVTQGAVTGVKNQGQCGSCWSFSTTGSTEGARFLAGHGLVSLSEQNLMDCSQSYGNQGCNGGWMDNAFRYIIANGGIDTEASYPYQTATSFNCRYNAANSGGTLSSFQDVTSGSESALLTAAAARPVSVAIDASHNSFQLYSSGVYYEPACSSSSLDHGVLVVGYGTSSSDYWIVKNSWGTGWGQAGYIWMSRNRSNNCGIATSASYPIA